jgi:hypothetical protein
MSKMNDYEITIPAECIGRFRELRNAAVDALGPDEVEVMELGKDLIRQLS